MALSEQGTSPVTLTVFVVVVVTFVWACVFIAALFTREYQPLIYASPPMGLVLGYVTGVRILKKVNGNGA